MSSNTKETPEGVFFLLPHALYCVPTDGAFCYSEEGVCADSGNLNQKLVTTSMGDRRAAFAMTTGTFRRGRRPRRPTGRCGQRPLRSRFGQHRATTAGGHARPYGKRQTAFQCQNNPSVMLPHDSSLYTREPLLNLFRLMTVGVIFRRLPRRCAPRNDGASFRERHCTKNAVLLDEIRTHGITAFPLQLRRRKAVLASIFFLCFAKCGSPVGCRKAE